jgi:hypothetical protein
MNKLIDKKCAIRQTAVELFAASLLEIVPKIILIETRATRLGFVLDFISPTVVDEEILKVCLERTKGKLKSKEEPRLLEMTSKNAYEYMRHIKQPFRMEKVDREEQFTNVVQIGDYANILEGEICLDFDQVGVVEIEGIEDGGEVLFYKKKTRVTRIKGMAEGSKEELKEHKKKIREAALKDHRKAQEYYLFDEAGMVWFESGLLERKQVEEKIREGLSSLGFKEVERMDERALFSVGEKIFEFDWAELESRAEFGLKDALLQRVVTVAILQRKRDVNSLLQLFDELSKIFPQLEDVRIGEDFISAIDPYGLDWRIVEAERCESGWEVTVWIDRLMALIIEKRLH